MKKWICLFLILSLAFALFGCTQPTDGFENPISFYYRRQDVSFSDANGVISPDIREAGNMDYVSLLALYFRGPANSQLQRTFPQGTSLKTIQIEGNHVFITLSDAFSTLTELDLSIACACLTRTVCEMTGTQQLTVRTESSLLDGNKTIQMSLENVILLDDSDIVVDGD